MTMQADKDAFEAFGILYYPFANTEAEVSGTANSATDSDMAFATTCSANMNGTGYAIAPGDVVRLAGLHRWIAQQATEEAANSMTANPAADIRRLVPSITAEPMYPGFPREVLEIDEALYRFHQALHYFSTYGIELLSELADSPVAVARGWLPRDNDPTYTPRETGEHETLVQAKVLKLVFSVEKMRDIVLERLAQPTRMHEAETRCAVKLLASPGQDERVDIAFHENMLALVKFAAEGTKGDLRRMLKRTAQHPGDVLKAVTYTRKNRTDGKKRLANRQKEAFCQAFEGFTAQQIATNIVDASPENRLALNYLSVARYGGPTLKEAIAAVESGQVKSWNSTLEEKWARLKEDGPAPLLAMYRERPGLLLRSLTRLLKADVPFLDILQAARAAGPYSKATLARTLAITASEGLANVRIHEHPHETELARQTRTVRQQKALAQAAEIVRVLFREALAATETPLRGKRVFVDAGDFSLEGSVVMPNDTGDTGTAYPPAGMAYRIPDDATVRFFTFWDDRKKRVDVDLHFKIAYANGTFGHVGWSGDFRTSGMVMSGDITHSEDAAEYLDLDLATARSNGVDHVKQVCHIFCGAPNWKDIDTCFSGAAIVQSLRERPDGNGRIDLDPAIYQADNVVFRDDMTGEGRTMTYALIDVVNGYVRLLRGAEYPFERTAFTLDAFVDMLLDTQGATRVDEREDAEVVLSVGRTEDEDAICLIDEGFFLK